MTLLDALILGLIQGLTEFLPVSSSGHLALGEHLLGLNMPGLGFEVWLHLATLTAVLAALRREIAVLLRALLPSAPQGPETRAARIMVGGLIVGTIPAAVVGLLAGDAVEQVFDNPKLVGVGLLITALILTVSRFIPEHRRPLTLLKAFGIGCGQALAILPGISRSGSTLTASLASGLSGQEAARFSFLLSVPAILGASVVEADSLVELGHASPVALGLGFVAAAVSGFFAIQVVWRVMERGRLWVFAPYCLVVGLLAVFLL